MADDDVAWDTPTPAPPPTAQPDIAWDTPPKPSAPTDERPMPGAIDALTQGIGRGIGQAEESAAVLRGAPPTVPSTAPPSPAAAPLEWGDIRHPGTALSKIAYGVGESAPTLAAGIAGGVAGGLTAGPPGSLIGGALGSAAGAAFQEIGPVFGEELRHSPNDPNGAWDRAMKRAGTSGLFSGVGWSLFPARFFSGPLKHVAFQAFGVQAPLAAGEQAVQNIIQGKPATENLGQAYATGVAGTAVPMLGHAALAGFGKPVPPGQRETPPPPDKPDMAPAYREIDFKAPVPGEGSDPSIWSRVPFGQYMDKAIMGWKKTFQPEMVSDLALQASGEFRRYVGGSAQARDSILSAQEGMHNAFEPLPLEQKIAFMKGAAKEEGFTVAPELKPYADEFHRLLEMAHESDRDMGSKLGYIEDYFPRQYTNPERAAAFINNRVASMGKPGFQKARSLDLLQDGLDAGLELVTYNPADLVTNRLLASAEVKEKVTLLQRLNQMGAAARLDTPGDVSAATYSGWHLIKDPVGQQWALHPDLKPTWDNVIATRGLWDNPDTAGNLFRGWMALKNKYVPLKLAISAFHPLHVAHININDGLQRGWRQLTEARDPLGALNSVAKGFYSIATQGIPGVPTEAKAARAAWLTPEWQQTPEQKAVVKLMVEGGFSPQLSEQLRMKGARVFNDALAHQEWYKAIVPGLGQLYRKTLGSVFEQWIPSLKTASYLDEAKALFQRRPDLLDNDALRKVALSTIAKSVDNRYGEMFYRGLFWNKALKDAGIGSFLSLGWNLGFAREFGGGLLEPLMRGAIEQTPTREAISAAKGKTSFAFLYMATAMTLNALTTKYMSGEDPEGMDYFLPRIGGLNPDGSPRRVSNMFYTREIPMFQKHAEEQQGYLGGAREMLWNKMMFEPLHEMLTNRDYYGYNIMDPTAPAYKQAYQLGKYILSDQFNPITIAGAKRSLQATGKWDDSGGPGAWRKNLQSIVTEPEGRMALLGFGPAPTYASHTATINRLNYLFANYVSPVERPMAEREVMEQRRDARNALALAQRTGNTEAATQAAQKLQQLGISTASMRKVKPGTQDLYMFQRLPYTIQTQFLTGVSREEFKRYYPKANKMTKKDPDIQGLVQTYYRQ